MKRIGIDSRLAYHRQAGITRYTQNLIQALAHLDSALQFTVFHHRKQGRHLRQPPHWRHRSLVSPVHHRWEQGLLRLELRRFRLNAVHFPDFIGPYRTNLPTVITVHDLAFLRWPEILTEDARAYYFQLERAVEHARSIIVPSQFTHDDLIRAFPQARGKTHVVHHAVDPLFMQREAVTAGFDSGKRDLDLPPRYLLHVGTIEPRKNVRTLLETFRIVRDRSSMSDLKLVLAGARGWLEDDLPDYLARGGLQEHCIFTGTLSDTQLVRAYRNALCVVHPALYEGFGFSLLEGMASGTPVVASSASCLPEIGGEAVLYAAPDDPESMADLVLDLLAHPQKARHLVEKGHSRVQEFSWSRTAELTLEAYRSALGSI